jgi:hypothetical protein
MPVEYRSLAVKRPQASAIPQQLNRCLQVTDKDTRAWQKRSIRDQLRGSFEVSLS